MVQLKEKRTLEYQKGSWRPLLSLALISIGLLGFIGSTFLSNSHNFLNYINKLTPQSNSLELNSKELVILKALEENFAGEWLKAYTKDNQLAGTNLKVVDWTLGKFKEFGLNDAYIDQYTSYVSYPLDQSLKLLKNDKIVYQPALIEDELEEDDNSSQFVPAFLGYAANGNVTAQYIYANYGTVDDFQALINNGVDISGKIVLIRYGKIYRGLKVKFAQDHGAAAVLLFTDTYDDGEVIEENGFEPYPNGLARNPSAIQRGSALFLSYTPGDPLTPGYAIKPGEEKSRVDPYKTIPKIPALPISFKEVQPILEKISGFGPKIDGWKGLVKDFDYSVGPNPDYELNLFNEQEFNITNMNNIMGKIKGKDESKYIIIGNHHDSWTPAAADPHSGSATLLEVIRAFNELTKIGWKPKYSIVFASWDGEEYGLLGSTEYGEYYENELKANCIAYINTDVSSIGNILDIESSPLLNNILKNTAAQLPYPNSTLSLLDHFNEKSGGKIGTLGSGSDFTVFLEHLGIPSVSLEFRNDLENSSVYQYHSLYDSYYWMEKFGDPGFVFHNLLAKYIAILTLNLSDTPVLPLRTSDYAVALAEYFNELDVPIEWKPRPLNWSPKMCHKMAHKKNILLSQFIDKINEKLDKLEDQSDSFDQRLADLEDEHSRWEDLTLWERIKLKFRTRIANRILQYYERFFLDKEGLNEREWFKHIIYASGRYTGYKGQELPGLAEAIEDEDFDDFVHRLKKFDRVLNKLLRHI